MNGGVCRTAPATPGLLNTEFQPKKNLYRWGVCKLDLTRTYSLDSKAEPEASNVASFIHGLISQYKMPGDHYSTRR